MKKHILTPLRWKGWERFCGFLQTARKTNEWVLNKVGVKRELLDAVKARKLAYYGHTVRKQGSCLEEEIMQGTVPGACRRGRPHTAWMDNSNTWTGLSMEESIRMTEINREMSIVWPTIGSRTVKEWNKILPLEWLKLESSNCVHTSCWCVPSASLGLTLTEYPVTPIPWEMSYYMRYGYA